jgi:hypothetical protein
VFKFVLGSLLSSIVWLLAIQHMNKTDLQIMTDQNELLMRQQDVLQSIEDNCHNRNWLEFDDEVYVCMHVNQMFNQLSHPPTPHFSEKSENDA